MVPLWGLSLRFGTTAQGSLQAGELDLPGELRKMLLVGRKSLVARLRPVVVAVEVPLYLGLEAVGGCFACGSRLGAFEVV